MKHIPIFFLLLLMNIVSKAQQLNNSSFYELYPVLHNPATAGSSQHAVIGGSFKTQWGDMPGSPKTGLVFGQAHLSNAKIGLGGYLYHDVTGPTSRNGLQLAYAYHIPVSEKSNFSAGFEARLMQLTFDQSKLQTELGSNDPVATTNHTRFTGDAGFGIAYTSPTFQIGASVSQLVQSKLNLYDVTGTTNEQSKLYRHYYVHGNYNWQYEEGTEIIPNFLLIYLPNAPVEFQGGVRVNHYDLFWWGLSWRTSQAYMFTAGFKLKHKLAIGYSFDVYDSPQNVFNHGNELLLRYEFLK